MPLSASSIRTEGPKGEGNGNSDLRMQPGVRQLRTSASFTMTLIAMLRYKDGTPESYREDDPRFLSPGSSF